MKILIACDKFKGSLTAKEACSAIRTGFEEELAGKPIEIRCVPLSDGGEGLATALTDAHQGLWKTKTVRDALGNPILAGYGTTKDGTTAFLEMAEASGLAQLKGSSLDPWRASTFGTGELLLDALQGGADHIILGIGGSATNDGGIGMAAALGFAFLDESGKNVESLPRRFDEVVRIERPDDLLPFRITIACDVRNPLLGENGCTRIYGPQKGIASTDFYRHEDRLLHLVKLLGEEGRGAALEPGSGAAGGLGFGCRVFLGANLEPGFPLVSRSLGLETAVDWADLVVTGEGRIDLQSLEGKAPIGVSQLAHEKEKKVIAFCGLLGAETDPEESIAEAFDEIYEIRDPALKLTENLEMGRIHLLRSARQVAKSFSV